MISPNALKVLYRLKDSGHMAYLVGGGVRDLLLGREPKDYDVATDAYPEKIKKNFRNGRLIGRRFRLVHVIFKDEIVEVSTFRSHHGMNFSDDNLEQPALLNDNVYGSLEEDADRRDFTVNALYYNIADFSIVDFHQGLKDLQHGILRIIGNPMERYREDPVRMLRAVRFAAKLGFRIHEESAEPLFKLHNLIEKIPPARLYLEISKLFLSGMAVETFKLLRHYGLLRYLFPLTEKCLTGPNYETINIFITHALEDTDDRIAKNKSVTMSYLLASLLWWPLQENLAQKNMLTSEIVAFQEEVDKIILEQIRAIAIPKYFLTHMRAIWELQFRLIKPKKSKIKSLLAHPRFRAAYDFLILRTHIDSSLQKVSAWWQELYEGDDATKEELLKNFHKAPFRKQPRRFSKKHPKKGSKP